MRSGSEGEIARTPTALQEFGTTEGRTRKTLIFLIFLVFFLHYTINRGWGLVRLRQKELKSEHSFAGDGHSGGIW